MSYTNIPKVWPFRMIINSPTPNVTTDFYGAWAAEQIKSFETKAYYQQKWQKADTTLLQVESTVLPDDMKIYNFSGQVVKTIGWSVAFLNTAYSIYELMFDIHDLPDGIYFIYQKSTFVGSTKEAISEPIFNKTKWPNTSLFTYKNSFNDFDVAWTTGIQMKFRCEAGVMDFDPQRGATDYVNQRSSRTLLSGAPSDKFTLYIGDQRGVAPYVQGILNRIFVCDYVLIDGIQYTAAADKWTVNRQKIFPLVGASIDIAPSISTDSLAMTDIVTLDGRGTHVTTFNIETKFFGEGAQVPIIEIEES
jgi:hypothetical protein